MSFCPWWCRVLLASSGPSPVAAGGAALVATCRLLTLVASLMRSRGSRPGGLQQLQHTGSVVGPLGLGCSTACRIFQTRDRTCLGRDVQCDLLSRYQLLWQNTIDWWTCITNASFSVLVARGPLSGCQHGQVLVRALLMSLHGLPWTVHTEQSWVVSSFYKDLNHIMKASSFWPNIVLIISQRLYLQIPSHQGLQFQHLSFGGHKIQSIATSIWKTQIKG